MPDLFVRNPERSAAPTTDPEKGDSIKPEPMDSGAMNEVSSVAETENTGEQEPAVKDSLAASEEREAQDRRESIIEKKEAGALKYPEDITEQRRLPGHSKSPLASFNYFPERIDFSNKDPEEKVVLLLRRHPITNLKWIIISFVLVVLPAFLSALLVLDPLPQGYRTLFFLGWYLFTFIYTFEKFLEWFFNVYIITDERVFDVDFYNLAYRKITDANIDQIQDVTVQIGGGIRTMFDYGDVIIQTAAEIPEIEFEAVPQPDQVAKILRGLRVEEEVEKLEGRVR